ncbi:MAG TPA: hypothetical protein PKK46_01395, partial [Acetomicrobium sp.]|nr:hypothetical protein [Acetomicrobium sp.]
RRTSDPLVAGSNPAGRAMIKKHRHNLQSRHFSLNLQFRQKMHNPLSMKKLLLHSLAASMRRKGVFLWL